MRGSRLRGNDGTCILVGMTAAEFIAKWRDTGFGERQGAQSFFNDICALVGHPTPAEFGDPQAFTFEKPVPIGSADAYKEEHFGWEFKGSDSQLDGAFTQLLRYSVYLKTPPLLIVSSFRTILIRTNFPGMETVLHTIRVEELDDPENLRLLRCAFHAPAELRPVRSVEEVTKETAALFRDIVADMEQRDEDPEKLARYLNQIVFCLYAEDAGLLPNSVFTELVRRQYRDPARFDQGVSNLFRQMATGGMYGPADIRHFNGDLFRLTRRSGEDGGLEPETIELSAAALQRLAEATGKNWQNIEPSIFGTLFERALDASKRAYLGAHYTGAEDIMLVVEPVVMAPLRREWKEARREIVAFLNVGDNGAARERLEAFQRRLAGVTVLDPACGSGNFLYLALRSLLELEKTVIDYGAAQDWPGLRPAVKPDQMLGLEINHYATELARTALWIGYIQWHQANGFAYDHSPILTPLDTIRQTDAILDLSDPANPKEPEWPAAEFIIGNPPFLGNKLLRTNLNDEYVNTMYELYDGRVPSGSDLVCYWFEKARALVEKGRAKRAGLLATQGIRGGANRVVLQRIKQTGDIFLAWSDRAWTLDGATVHVSIVGFDVGTETRRELNGESVVSINGNLTSGADLTQARRLQSNVGIAFQGNIKSGPFDISESVAQNMLNSPNPHGKSNGDVVKPWVNARDITDRSRNMWIIDFGNLTLEEAALYESPFEYVNHHVRPVREHNRDKRMQAFWWQLGRNRGEFQTAVSQLERFMVTPRVSKHRLFSWAIAGTSPDNAVVAIARDDDYTFGVMCSYIHEVWSRATGTQLRESESGFRYSHTATFETFPFPEPTDQQREAIAEAARELNQLRETWLNPPGLAASELKRRTLTNLYNARPTWLDNAHSKLDVAVAAAYGWPADMGEQEVLGRLLALNLGR